MKKCLFLLMMFVSLNVMGQDTRRVYCEIVGTEKFLSSKVTIEVDFGQQRSTWTNGRYYKTLVNENGKKIEFQSMVDAMNYMGTLGWKFEQAYVITEDKTKNIYHWLLSKDITDGELINEGLRTRDQANKERKQAASQEQEVSSPKKKRFEDDMYR